MPGPAAPASGGGGSEVDLSAWTWWWELNKEPFLDLKSRVLSGEPATGDDGVDIGRGSRRQVWEALRPTREAISTQIVPAIVRALERAEQNDVITGAMVALARIGDDYSDAERRAWSRMIEGFLTHSSQEVRETAVLSLGILGQESASMRLGELLAGSPAGRELLGGDRVDQRTQAFAAYSLGLVGHSTEREDVRRYVVHQLVRSLREDEFSAPDVHAACVLALGLVPLGDTGTLPESEGDGAVPATTGREAQVVLLLDLLDDDDANRFVRAQAPLSLARLVASRPCADPLRARVLEGLVPRLDPRQKEKREVIQSCAIALGKIGTFAGTELDEAARDALVKASTKCSDRQARHYAMIALGRMALASEKPDEKALTEVRRLLLKELARGKQHARPWAALALGMVERAVSDSGELPSDSSLEALRSGLAAERNPLNAGAYSLACGIGRDPASTDALLEQLEKLGTPQARGHVCVGLGLIEAREAIDPVREIVSSATYRPLLLREASVALGLLGDKMAVEHLLDRLTEARSLAAQASLAAALGRIGDSRTIEPLIEMLENDDLTASARAFAAVALGRIGDADPLPWNTPLTVDCNYTAAPVTLFDHSGFGVLNIL